MLPPRRNRPAPARLPGPAVWRCERPGRLTSGQTRAPRGTTGTTARRPCVPRNPPGNAHPGRGAANSRAAAPGQTSRHEPQRGRPPADAAKVNAGTAGPARRRSDHAARVTGAKDRAFAQLRGLMTASLGPGKRSLFPAAQPMKRPDPGARAAPDAVAVAVLCCCTLDPGFRILLLTCGAKEIRTPDLLHAIQRQPVHPRPSAQVTVLPRPLRSARVQACCGTFLLYRRRTGQPNRSRPLTGA